MVWLLTTSCKLSTKQKRFGDDYLRYLRQQLWRPTTLDTFVYPGSMLWRHRLLHTSVLGGFTKPSESQMSETNHCLDAKCTFNF